MVWSGVGGDFGVGLAARSGLGGVGGFGGLSFPGVEAVSFLRFGEGCRTFAGDVIGVWKVSIGESA